ncbi:NUMOD4 domain-containing protein [Ligilactobacillus sp. LYQ60]|uniref:NUMOD4 domain-containing protein n=1 Tax=Ligilactobacillus sp. LYQ60 TaxID=3378799 RepID=UPI003852375D
MVGSIERWEDIPGYEGLYQVSDYGRVRMENSRRLLKPFDNGKGYLRIKLNNDSGRRAFYVHKLVLATFSDKPLNYPLEVNHRNEIKSDNRLANLEWVTRRENMNYGTAHIRIVRALQRPCVLVRNGQAMYFSGENEASRALGLHCDAVSGALSHGYKVSGYVVKRIEKKEMATI